MSAAGPSLAAVALLALSAPASAAPPPRAAPASTSRFMPELPVMPGLWESGSGYSYPLAPGARLAETRLVGRTAQAQVFTFYAGALAGAGWRRAGAPWIYRRGRERLLLHLAPHRAAGSVQTEALFVVVPDAAAPAAAPPRSPHPARRRR